MLRDNGTCQTLCRAEVPAEDAKFINERIREDYALNWLIDGLPAAEMKNDTRTGELFFDMGFNLGNDEGEYAEIPALNNHYDIVLKFVLLLLTCRSWMFRCKLAGIMNLAPMSTVLSESWYGRPGEFQSESCHSLRANYGFPAKAATNRVNPTARYQTEGPL